MAEYCDLYDCHRIPLGTRIVRGEKIPKGQYRMGMDAWFVGRNGDILLQRRSLTKSSAPGYWACLGGGVQAGETMLGCLMRETREEMGFECDINHVTRVISFMEENEHIDVFVVRQDVDLSSLVLQEEEVMDAKIVTFQQFKTEILPSQSFWPYPYLPLLMRYLEAEV